MEDDVRRLVESGWVAWLGISRADLRTPGVQVVAADLGANAAMSFLFAETCIVVVPPNDLAATVTAVQRLDPLQAFTEDFLRSLVGNDALIEGPSWHGYVNRRAFTGCSDESVRLIDPADDALVEFLSGVDAADVVESGFSLPAHGQDDSVFAEIFAFREHGRITGVGTMSEWRGLRADVGVLTHPSRRGHGLATRLVATMVDATLPEAGVIRYRALASNLPSLAVARRLGFEPFGQNYRARRA